jgi:DNA-binding NtrC family response regulator
MTSNNPTPKVVRPCIAIDQHNVNRLKHDFSNSQSSRQTVIAFIESNGKTREKCEQILSIENVFFKSFPSFEAALNFGADRSASLFVLPESFPNASRVSFSKLLSQRSQNQVRVIIHDNSPIEVLTDTIKDSLNKVYQTESRKFVINRIVKLNSITATNSADQGMPDSSEIDLKEFLNKELMQAPDQSPDQILAKAIQVIKEIK